MGVGCEIPPSSASLRLCELTPVPDDSDTDSDSDPDWSGLVRNGSAGGPGRRAGLQSGWGIP